MNTPPPANPEGDPTAPEVARRIDKSGQPLPPLVEILWGVPLSEIDTEEYRKMRQIPRRKRKKGDSDE